MADEKDLEKTSENLENEVLEELNEEKEVEAVEAEDAQTSDAVQEETVEEEYNGPVVKTKTRYDYRTMKYFNMYNMMYRKHFRIVYIIMGLLSFGFAGYTAYVAFTQDTIEPMRLVLTGIFALFGVYFIYQSICFEKVIDKNITMHFYKNPKVVELSVTVTEREVILQIDSKDKKGEPFPYDWAYVTDIVEIPQYFFLYVQKQPIIIEKDPNKIVEGDYDTLVNIIMEKAKAKPFKRIDKELVTKPITYVHQEDLDNEAEAEAVNEEDYQVNDTNTEVDNTEVNNQEEDKTSDDVQE